MKLAHHQLNGATSQQGAITSANTNNQTVLATPEESLTTKSAKKLGRAVSFDESCKS